MDFSSKANLFDFSEVIVISLAASFFKCQNTVPYLYNTLCYNMDVDI